MSHSPPSLTFRAARAGDRAAVLEAVGASGLFEPDEVVEVAEMLEAFLDGAAAGDRWLVDADVGAVAYVAPERMADAAWNLLMRVVHPGRQRQGLGAALVVHVENELRRAGGRLLLIETSGVPAFAGQRAFYAGLGYHAESQIRDFYAAGDDKVTFVKALRPPASPASGLRLAAATDLPELLGLAADFYSRGRLHDRAGALQANLAHLLAAAAARVIVVATGGRLAAFAVSTTSFGLEDGLIAELEDLYVVPAWRRRGLASELAEDAARWARERGCAKLDVVLAPNGHDLEHLRAYYAARGFVDDGRRLQTRTLEA